MTLLAMMMTALFGGINAAQAIDWTAQCQNEVQGMKILVSSATKVRRPDLYSKINALDFRAFCSCYHGTLRNTLGKDLYERSRTIGGVSMLTETEVMRVGEQDTSALVACAEAQLANRSVPANHYQDFIRSTVRPRGVGGLKLGNDRAEMFSVLGPTETFRPRSDGTQDYFYGPNSIEVIVSLSPAGTVRQITLNNHFQGYVAGGGRIGDSRERIRRLYPGRIAEDSPEFLVYCDGTTFIFRNDRLETIRLSDLDADLFAGARRSRCQGT